MAVEEFQVWVPFLLKTDHIWCVAIRTYWHIKRYSSILFYFKYKSFQISGVARNADPKTSKRKTQLWNPYGYKRFLSVSPYQFSTKKRLTLCETLWLPSNYWDENFFFFTHFLCYKVETPSHWKYKFFSFLIKWIVHVSFSSPGR